VILAKFTFYLLEERLKVLKNVVPSKEQLKIITLDKPGITLIRGAAGSGKTTTALLRLKYLAAYWKRRKEVLGLAEPVKILVLTFNRTLRGYIEELAAIQIAEDPAISIRVLTFAKWSLSLLNTPRVLDDENRYAQWNRLSRHLGYGKDFILDEIEYALGRFGIFNIADYVNCRRDGRGASPRVDAGARQRIIDEVIRPYEEWKKQNNYCDWNDLATALGQTKIGRGYDIIIADEAQDFSANQIRAIVAQLANEFSLTFILDAAQRIYPRGFAWKETGVVTSDIHRLEGNFRNTIEIARFAQAIVASMEMPDDGTLPDFSACTQHGDLPLVLKGKYGDQLKFIVKHIKKKIDLDNETVAFLHPKGGGWFDFTKDKLDEFCLNFVVITQRAEWPQGPQNIALSTFHSAKGLEFDHVFILGLDYEVTPHGAGDGDSHLENYRRLLAMAVGRARKSVIIGYKPSTASTLFSYLEKGTFDEVEV